MSNTWDDFAGQVARLERMLDLAGAQNMGIDNLAKLDDLQQQLAAEREGREGFQLGKARCEKQLDATVTQLAAEREKAQMLVDALKELDIAYQRIADTPELRACVHRGDFNEIGDKMKEARTALEKAGRIQLGT